MSDRLCAGCAASLASDAHANRRYCSDRCAARARYQKRRETIREAQAAYYRANRERIIARGTENMRTPEGRARRNEAARRRYRENPAVRAACLARTPDPVKRQARTKIYGAIRRGKVERQPCEVCGATPTHAHHEDYSQPLDVRFLCSVHHGEAHRKTTALVCQRETA